MNLFEPYLRLESILERESATEILKRTLSAGIVHSSESTFATRQDAERLKFSAIQLRDIGRGSCGSVFEVPGTAYAIKKGSNIAAIWNDFNLTNHAYNSCVSSTNLMKYAFPGRRIPRVPMAQFYNSPTAKGWWDLNITRFPVGDRKQSAVFYLDHILPVPPITRFALVREFFLPDSKAQHKVLTNIDNQDCLVRVYFGQNYPHRQLYDSTDTLRNFPLYLDQAKRIGLDIYSYAEEMAIGLAILHWEAQIDAQDTEFVIGTSTTKIFGAKYPDHTSTPQPETTVNVFTSQETQLWMLDYDKCAEVSFDTLDLFTGVVEKYLVAVTGNDPYFPHPRLDRDLWERFRKTYLEASQITIRNRRLNHQISKLPGMLLVEWEQWGDRDVEAAEEDFDPFERHAGDSVEEGDEDDDDEEEESSDEEEGDEDEADSDPKYGKMVWEDAE